MRAALAAAAILSLCTASCGVGLFSGENWIDRNRPAVLVETTGGIECGAATEFGVLTLGRSARSGPCRVRYFLGPTPIVETGTLQVASATFSRAEIDLKTQLVRCLDRSLAPTDELQVQWTLDGETTQRVGARLATAAGITGDVLDDPGEPLPAGATVLCRSRVDEVWLFAGLIAGRATLEGPGGGSYYVVAGPDRVRELLAVPRQHPVDLRPKYRTDDISVLEPVPPAEAATTPAPTGSPAPLPPPPGPPRLPFDRR